MEFYNRLLDLAIREINNLKRFAEPIEMQRLAGSLDTGSRYDCIYGKMTGSCDSERAISLINQCSLNRIQYDLKNNLNLGWDIDTIKFVETPRDKTFGKYSPLETLLFYCTADDVRNIVNFLTGKAELQSFQIDQWKYKSSIIVFL